MKRLIYLIMFILFASFVLGIDNANLVYYYSYDNAGDTTIFDLENNVSMTELGTVTLNASCIQRGCAFFDAVGDGYKQTNTDWNTTPSQWDHFTMCYLFWDSGFTNDGKLIIISDTSLTQPYYRNYEVSAGTTIDMHYQASAGTINLQTSAVALSTWQLRCFVMNGTTSATFKNGVKETEVATVARISAVAPTSFLSVNANFGGQSGATWYVDEMSIWNISLKIEDMVWLWNSGAGRNHTDIENEGVDITPPTNTSLKVTSPVAEGENRTSWNTDGLKEINITTNNLFSFIFISMHLSIFKPVLIIKVV